MAANFTGIWKLIRGESEFGFLGAPQSRQDAILHEGSRICIRTRQKDANGDLTVERDLLIDGEAATVQIYGRAREVRASWDDEALVIETRSEVSGKARRIEDRWTLDPDGQWITIERVHEQPGGDVRQRLRLEKR